MNHTVSHTILVVLKQLILDLEHLEHRKAQIHFNLIIGDNMP